MRIRECALAICLLSFSGCVDEEATARLDNAIRLTETGLAATLSEREAYEEGSALQAVASLRLSIQEQTLAMLEQKRAAAFYYPRFSYTVNGNTYAPPQDVDQRIEGLKRQLTEAEAEWARAKEEASKAEGVVRTLALMGAETKGLLVGQLEYQLVAYQHGFPPLVALVDAPGPSSEGAQPGTGTRGSPAKPLALGTGPSVAQQEKEAMEAAISVRLLSKAYRPSDAVAGAYEGRVRLELEYANTSGKDIRAFTGTLVFMDLFDRDFLRVSLTVNDPISAGQKLRDQKKQLRIKRFKDSHQKLLGTQTKDIRTRFEPQSILFEDDTKLGSVNP